MAVQGTMLNGPAFGAVPAMRNDTGVLGVLDILEVVSVGGRRAPSSYRSSGGGASVSWAEGGHGIPTGVTPGTWCIELKNDVNSHLKLIRGYNDQLAQCRSFPGTCSETRRSQLEKDMAFEVGNMLDAMARYVEQGCVQTTGTFDFFRGGGPTHTVVGPGGL